MLRQFLAGPGDGEVIEQRERDSSSETKIARRSVRIAVGASAWSATICIVVFRVGVLDDLTLPRAPIARQSPKGSVKVAERVFHATTVVARPAGGDIRADRARGRRQKQGGEGGSRPDQRDEAYVVAYYSNKRDLSREQLRGAVTAVGPMADDVQRYLNKG
jgi:hypothetical protein